MPDDAPTRTLSEAESKALLAGFGVPLAAEQLAAANAQESLETLSTKVGLVLLVLIVLLVLGGGSSSKQPTTPTGASKAATPRRLSVIVRAQRLMNPDSAN